MINLLQSMTFVTPLALAALALLPVIWWLLRFTPPRPVSVNFPPVRILLDLVNSKVTPDKTPWWLLVLRLLIAALVILGISHPLLRPGQTVATQAPLLLIMDDGWGSSADWLLRRDIAGEVIDSADDANQTVTLAFTAEQARLADIQPMSPTEARRRIAAHEPQALPTNRSALLARLQTTLANADALQVAWLTDGLGQEDASTFAEGLKALAGGRASVEVFGPEISSLPMALARPEIDKGAITIRALRPSTASPLEVEAQALAGNGRELGRVKLTFPAAGLEANAPLELPIELRNSIERIALLRQPNAAATFLLDDRWRRKTVALMSGNTIEDDQPLLSPLYYVSRALEPYAQLSEPSEPNDLKQSLDSGLSMLVLADIGVLSEEATSMINPWLERGGVLVRFAGPRLAASQDNLLPVTLREGGRELGSAMSWEAPQPLTSFSPATPFADFKPDANVTVSRQVLAEPEADLSTKVWASLSDGTPLVTASPRGRGLIVLFHVTASPEWSNLPLSGQFVDMLRAVVDRAPSAGAAGAAEAQAAITSEGAFRPRLTLAANGELVAPPPEARPLEAAEFATVKPAPQTPAGIYARGQMQRAINLDTGLPQISAATQLPSGVVAKELKRQPRTPLAPGLFLAAMVLFLGDCLIALGMGGAFRRKLPAAAAVILMALFINMPQPMAQMSDDELQKSANSLRLAYVTTGDASVDEASEQGLKGLTQILSDRTSVSAADPVAVNIDRDEIVFYPLLYWPVLPTASEPSAATLQKMDLFMKNGGTIFFDLRDDGNDFGNGGGASEALRRIVANLNVPPLEPVPPGHVLTKSFYLLSDFPGRYDTGKLWVERSDGATASNVDGVSTIIIGTNDYAAAWALDETGAPLYSVIPPDERQREMAFRSGVNIVMYALTGNYKSDQVHVPALLERLGQ